MAENERASILSWIRRMTAEAGGASDAQLLDRFSINRDEAAFELLLRRHAQIVFDVCLRVLHDLHDAEDAFQATFLALARHAGSIAKREAVASWLYKVAYRSALTARSQRARRHSREKLCGGTEHLSVSPDADSFTENQELRGVLDQEIGRLPERFRAAVVLCYLEGKSVNEAAMLLGCPRGTVASRLARAREHLRVRLAGRGLALTAALAIFTQANAATRPLALIPSLTAAALRYTTKGAAASGVLSPRIIALTEEVLRAMFLHKVKTGILVLIVFVGILLVGSGLAHGLRGNPNPQTEPPNKEEVLKVQAAARAEEAPDKPVAKAPHPVTVSHPVRREAVPYQDYTGRLEPRRAVDVRPTVSGIVLKVCFKAGAEVKEEDVLFELDARLLRLALDKAEAELALAEAKKKQSDGEMKRARALNTVSPEDLDKVTERAATAEAALKLAKIEVIRARLELDATKVKAPMAGRVGRSLVEPGTLVFRGQDRATLLTTVTALDPIKLAFDMDERSFLDYQRLLREKKVKGAGSSLRMRLAAEEEFAHEGKLESLEDHISADAGTVRVHGSFPNPGGWLLPGMFVRVRMTLGPPRAVLEVPEEAILSDQGRKYVLVVNDRNVAERRAITPGPIDNGMRIIEKGLHAEDWVVIVGHVGIRPGDSVEPRRKASPE
ncbi:MAG TPA: efflux RND transporter periplasmic adaptor subunit [Gemmataceae bacterium]|nr:efflux RND transporter periplasmic adaptor subunit [Gemmataceae bacterium]